MTATQVTIPSNSSLLYKELIKQRLDGDDLWSYLYCGYVAVDWRSRNPTASVEMITAKLTACSASVQNGLGGEGLAGEGLGGEGLAVAYPSVETVGLRAAACAAQAVGDDVGNLLGSLVSARAQAVRKLLLPEADKFPDWQAGAFSSQAPGQMQAGTDAILGVIADAVTADPDLRTALDAFALSSGNKIGLGWPSPGSTTANSDVLNVAADWPALFKDGLQPDGSIIAAVQSLADEFDAQVLVASAVASSMSGQVQAADASIASAAPGATFALDDLSIDFNTVLAALSAATRPDAAAASNSTATSAQNNAAALKYAQNSISAIAQAIGLVDPQAANIVTVTGSAIISAATAIADYAKTTTTLNQLLGSVVSGIGNVVGGALLTGNLLGAAMSIIGLFAGAAPNPQMVLLQNVQKAIAQVSQQVSALKQDVDTRLDHVDAMLSVTLEQVLTGFAALTDLEVINETALASISSQLVQLAEQVNRIDTDMQEWLQLVEVQTDLLEQGENPVLDWWYTHLDPADILAYSGADPNFVATDNTFYTWATDIAVTGPQVTVTAPTDPVSIAAQLTKPLSWDVNVIAGALTNLHAASFYDGSAGVPLPNPVVWARAASDYAELQLEWLSYAQKLNMQRIADVAGPGLTLLGALATLATLSHPDGVPAASPVFDGVRDGYLAALAGQPLLAGSPSNLISALQGALVTWQGKYASIANGNGSLPSGSLAPDPFGPVDQSLTLGTVTGWGPPNPMQLGGWLSASEQSQGQVQPPDQASMLSYLPPVLHNYFYFNSQERSKFALLVQDAGFINAVSHIKWINNHTDEIDWVTGTYGAIAEVRFNAYNSANVASWPVVLRRQVDTGVHGGGTNNAPGNQDTYAWLTSQNQFAGENNWLNSVLPLFDAKATTLNLAAEEQSALDAIIIQLTPSVTSDLLASQAQACEYLANDVATGLSMASGQALSAWQELMIQLIRLALPGRILRDDLLRCLMYGPEAPPDQSGVATLLTARANAPQLGEDIIAELSTAASARIDALHDAVINALLALESAGVYDWPPDVVGALQRLQVVAAARPGAPAITLPSRPPGVAPVDPAAWYVITVSATGHLLEVSAAGAVAAGPADGTTAQQWQLQVQPDSSYQVISRASSQCVGLNATGQVVQQGWSNTSQQRWYLAYERPQYVRLVNAATGQTIAATPAAVGAPDLMAMQDYDGAAVQQFAIMPLTPPQLQTSSSLAVGTGPIAGSVTAPLTISNLGTLSLTITSMAASGSFSVSATTAQVLPDAQLIVSVTFSPAGLGPAAGSLTIVSNDPNSPTIVALTGNGQGLAAPRIAIDSTVSPGNYLVGITGAAGADFFYTVDGSTPTANSTPFVADFSVSARLLGTTVKAIAVLAGVGTSPVGSLVIPGRIRPE